MTRSAERRLGWGIAGCGWVARDYGGPAIEQSANGRLLALYDPSAASLATFGSIGVAKHGDLELFLATPGLEAVYVAAPNHAHRALAERCAAAGLAVLCEKPMATSLADAEAMVRACRDAGVPFATAFDQRYHGAHQRLRGLVAEGALGTVTALRIVYACWLPGDWAADNWRIDPARAGGGALMDLAPHGVDLAGFLLGEPVAELAAFGQRRIHDYAVDDGAVLMGRTAGGVLVQIHVAYNHAETLPRRRLELLGTKGLAIATDTMGQTGGGTLALVDAAGDCRPVAVPGIDRSPFLGQVEAFAQAVLDGRDQAFSPDGDLHVMRLIEEAQAASGFLPGRRAEQRREPCP